MQHDHGIDIVAPLAHWPRVTLEETLAPGRSRILLAYNPNGGAGLLSTAAATT